MDLPYVIHHGDCMPWLRSLPDNSVDHVIADCPYSEEVHSKSRSGRNLPDAENGFDCKARRAVEFGFEHITPEQIDQLAAQYARLAKRWVIVFSDVESSHLWRQALERYGLDFCRTGAWIKQRGTPQFTGDRPGTGFEALTIAHRKGRKRWNAGGKVGVWTHPVVANCNGHRQDRVHTTQKPLSLMMELIEDFTDPGETICDSHSGSFTTAVAAIRLGRRFIGCELQEKYVEIGRQRLEAEVKGIGWAEYRNGQQPLFRKGAG